MSDPKYPQRDEQTESFLDDLRDGRTPGRAGDSPLERELELQSRIDARLAALFSSTPPDSAELEARLRAAAVGAPRRSSPRLWWAAAAAAVAAAVAWIALFSSPPRDDKAAPHFVARPLAQFYREAVADGFEPYYECREADRFAETFQRRQGVPLALLPLPAGVRMLGLSYPGGLSRDTTGMLCEVDQQPVMVFVDRAEADNPAAADGADAATRVFRTERDGLVFYEVTPLDAPRVMELMAVADVNGTAASPSAP